MVGLDSINDYYDPALKKARVDVLGKFDKFTSTKSILPSGGPVERIFRDGKFGPVVHLAAQAGVRYSLQNPHAYLDANLAGFLNVLEGCRHRRTRSSVFASSSSVYGANTHLPFSVHDNVDHPISLYAATKKANELMAHAYSHLYGLPATGLRFFTVYGPWGRPDMAMYIFAKAIAEGQPIRLFNQAGCGAISPMSTTWSKRSSASSQKYRKRTQLHRTANWIRQQAPRRGEFTISAIIAPSKFLASSRF